MIQVRDRLVQPGVPPERGTSFIRPGSLEARLKFARAMLISLALLASSQYVLGQTKSPTPLPTPPPLPSEQEVDPGDVISVNTTEVSLPVTVRDRAGLLVNNLTAKDF